MNCYCSFTLLNKLILLLLVEYRLWSDYELMCQWSDLNESLCAKDQNI